MSVHGTVDRPGLPGTFEIIRAPNARRIAMWVDGIFRSSGHDEKGSWTQGTHGAVIRLKPGEVRNHNAWIEQRKYLTQYDAKRDQSACDVMEGRALARLKFNLPDEGEPLIVFDNETAELIASLMVDVDGSLTEWRYEKWSPPDAHGARWPVEELERGETGSEARLVVTKTEPGLVCPPLSPTAPPAPECLQPHAARIAYDWSAGKRGRMAMKDDLDIVTFTTKAGSKDITTLFDPTESILGVVDEPQGAKAAFTSTKHFTIDKVSFDLGTIDLGLGAVLVKHAPALMRGIGNMDTTGAERPMILSGVGLTSGLAVRVDHAKREIVVAPSGDSLAAKNATAIPIKLLGGEEIVVEATIDGAKAPMGLQFQAALGTELYDTWGNAHGIPGTHPTVQLDKTTTIMRVPKIELGPIHYENQLARVGIKEATHGIAGRLSVSVLLRCSAFVLDSGARTLWLEPPCDRPVLEDMAGWTLVRDVTSTDEPKDRPWKVAVLLKNGSADRAGIKEGDRILDIGGKPATLDRGSFLPLLGQKPGTKLDITLMRDTEKKKISMTLVKLLP
jgi:hypothetical protein